MNSWQDARAGPDLWHLWINDGLTAVFFSILRLEVKREIVAGTLQIGSRTLPALAIMAGIGRSGGCPYAVCCGGCGTGAGQTISAATDIAFAVE